jgi:hypothetical protein
MMATRRDDETREEIMKNADQVPTSRKSVESAKDKKEPRAVRKSREKVRNWIEKHKPRP